MHKFLYLREKSWIESWVNGGHIPISLASRYVSNDRVGIMTPDEKRIYKSRYNRAQLANAGLMMINCKNIVITNHIGDGERLDTVHSDYEEDGAILSFCDVFDLDIALRLKKKACVKIKSINRLKHHIDKQAPCISVVSSCQYTLGHDRNHFLKSNEDSWQREFRMFWGVRTEFTVKLPSGIAEVVWIDDSNT